MFNTFLKHTRCPLEFLPAAVSTELSAEAGFFSHDSLTLFGRVADKQPVTSRLARLPSANGVDQNSGTCLKYPFLFDEVVNNLRMESYIEGGGSHDQSNLSLSGFARTSYYAVRPFLPVFVRKHFQRLALKGRARTAFPSWPVDTTVDNLMDSVFRGILLSSSERRIPFIWFWPYGCDSACILTHDVETRQGRDFCGQLMLIEREFGLASSFEIVPEQRYEVTKDFLDEIRSSGCEVCVHGFNHDGHLFRSRKEFLQRAPAIDGYLREFNAIGFRSPIMYRRLDWLSDLKISYDMSVPNSARFDPQPGGCCTDLPPRTSPPSKLDLGPLEVHSPEQNRVLVTWGVWPPAPEADRPRRCEAVSGCTPFATSRLAPLLPTTCRRSLH